MGWAIAALSSVPMLFVFRLVERNGSERCENIFRDKPLFHRQLFLTYIAVIVFFIPLIMLIICYARIFLKIAQKASENVSSNRMSMKPGKVHLQSTKSSSLPKAKKKTLKMTLVIVAMYIACGLPYFTAELIMSYGDHRIISPTLYSILGAVAPANSAANPYVFLMFSVNYKTLHCPKWQRVAYTDTDATCTRYVSATSKSDMLSKAANTKPYNVKTCHSTKVEMTNLVN